MGILRQVGGVLAGVVAAGAVVAGVEAVAHAAVSGPALFAAVAAGYGLAAFGGTAVAARIASARAALAIPLVLAALSGLNLLTIAHPWWFVPVAAVALVVGWRLGLTLGRPR